MRAKSVQLIERRTDPATQTLRPAETTLYGYDEIGPAVSVRARGLLMAVEDRIVVGGLASGGLRPRQIAPEVDPMNFAPYLRKPVLMVNGRHDFLYPYETSQLPLFELLGSGAEDKRHVVVDSGHVPPNNVLAKEMLEWLDRYLGVPR